MDDTLHLLVIDDSSNDAETVSSMLRNAGHTARAERVEDDEDLREQLGKQRWDMVLTKPEITFFSAADALSVIAQSKLDLPLLIIADQANDKTVDELLAAGARDTVLMTQPARLIHTILREAHDTRMRQQLSLCQGQLSDANRRAQTLVDSSRDAITYVHEGMYIYANESYLEMFGYSDMEEIEGMPIMDMVKSDDHAKFKQFLRDYTLGKISDDKLEVQGLKTDGSSFTVNMEFTPATFEEEPCTQIVIRVQTMSKELEKKLDDMSKLDLLTNVYNRQYFLEEIEQLSGKKNMEGVVLAIQPDGYKRIRDELGIAASDQFLAVFAKHLADSLPGNSDFVARFEGELFTAILHGIQPEQAEEYAKKLCKQIEDNLFDIAKTTATTTCSIGIGIYNETVPNHQEVITRAERALTECLENGGNRVRLYRPGADEMADQERNALLIKQIKMALRDNRLRLLFQPIVSLKGDANENYEAFVRMEDDKGNELLPGNFLPAAEKGGLMGAIDRWILAHAIKAVTEQRRSGKPTVIFAKLSATSLKDEKLLPWLRDILKAAGAVPNSLVIEVSETVASNNLKTLKMLLAGLAQLHVRLAIDHFGNAPNFANLLKHCDADFLKLDASIIGRLTSDKEAQQKVLEITTLASEGNKKVVANAVEDPHTLATIYSTGIDYIQGYFLQEPSPRMEYDFSSMG